MRKGWATRPEGVRVGVNRPDLQYTLNGQRHYIEYESAYPGRGLEHASRTAANDPAGIITIKY